MPDIICITETKLDKSIDDSDIDIPNYCVHRRDKNHRGGSVAIYYKDHLDAMPLVFTSRPCSMVECAAVKLTSWWKSIIIVNI